MKSFKQVRLSPATHKELRVYAAIIDKSLSETIMLMLKESKTKADTIQKALAPTAP